MPRQARGMIGHRLIVTILFGVLEPSLNFERYFCQGSVNGNEDDRKITRAKHLDKTTLL